VGSTPFVTAAPSSLAWQKVRRGVRGLRRNTRVVNENRRNLLRDCAFRYPFSTVFAGQAVGIKEVHDDIWLVSFMDYDLGYFDLETRVLEPLENPFGPKVLPMS
jgi:hypothetical protein